MKVKLSKYAKLNSICYRTAYLWYRDGKIKERTEMSPSGSIFVYLDDINDKQTPIYTYSRVSSNNKKDDAISLAVMLSLSKKVQPISRICINVTQGSIDSFAILF